MDIHSLDPLSPTVHPNRRSLHPYERPSLLCLKVVRFNHLRRLRAGSQTTVCTPSRRAQSPPRFLAHFQPQISNLATLRLSRLLTRRLRPGKLNHRLYLCSHRILLNCNDGPSRDRGNQIRIPRTRAATAACRGLGPLPVSLEATQAPCFLM